jgi:CheY-like chemotaxis protein
MTKKILVADDSVTIHMIVNLTFAGEDVSVQAVTDGERAIEKAQEFKPDVILADVDMPGLGGYELCERIKSDPELERIPVILLARTVEPFDEDRARRIGSFGYLTKPFATAELIQIVHAACEMKTEPPATVQPARASKPTHDASLVSQRTRDSFLGANRILDVFGLLLPPEQTVDDFRAADPRDEAPFTQTAPVGPATKRPQQASSREIAVETASEPAESEPALKKVEFELSEKTMNAIVEKVVRHLSQEVVREIAWDVVPELAEIAIRQWLRENMQKDNAAKTSSPAR